MGRLSAYGHQKIEKRDEDLTDKKLKKREGNN